MKQHVTLTIASLLSLILFTFHLTDDVLHVPMDASGTIICLAIMLVLLYGTVELAGRRLGFVIMLLGGLASAYMPFLHGMGPRATRWGFFFIWTMLAMGVTGSFAAILSAKALWRSFRANASDTQPRDAVSS
jgi:hypothetical protein